MELCDILNYHTHSFILSQTITMCWKCRHHYFSRKITSKYNPIKAGVIIAQCKLWYDFAYSSATAGVEVLK